MIIRFIGEAAAYVLILVGGTAAVWVVGRIGRLVLRRVCRREILRFAQNDKKMASNALRYGCGQPMTAPTVRMASNALRYGGGRPMTAPTVEMAGNARRYGWNGGAGW